MYFAFVDFIDPSGKIDEEKFEKYRQAINKKFTLLERINNGSVYVMGLFSGFILGDISLMFSFILEPLFTSIHKEIIKFYFKTLEGKHAD